MKKCPFKPRTEIVFGYRILTNDKMGLPSNTWARTSATETVTGFGNCDEDECMFYCKEFKQCKRDRGGAKPE